MKLRTISLEYRDHDDGNSAFLVFKDKDGSESHLEWDFVLDAVALRDSDGEAFDLVWAAMDAFAERGAPIEGLDS